MLETQKLPMMPRNVAVIAYHYYPSSQSAVHRPGQLSKYLAECGWTPHVICADWTPANCGSSFDHSLVGAQANAHVFRKIPLYDSVARVDLINPLMRWRRMDGSAILWRIVSRIVPWFPIDRRPYDFYRRAVAALEELVATRPIDVIWATCPPPVTHAVAAYVAGKNAIPWVADFRDIWDQKSLIRDEGQRRKLIAQEVTTLRGCSAAVTISGPLREKLQSRHRCRVHVIPNGFDPSNYSAPSVKRSSRFEIVYTGNVFFPLRDPTPIFTALRSLFVDQPAARAQIKVIFYGKNDALSAHVKEKYPDLVDVVVIRGNILHRDLLTVQLNASVLLLLTHTEDEGILTGKLFEYLGAKRPIVCCPGDGTGVNQILAATGAGEAWATEREAYSGIDRLYSEWKRSGSVKYQGDEEMVKKYSRKSQAAELIKIFDQVLASAKNA